MSTPDTTQQAQTDQAQGATAAILTLLAAGVAMQAPVALSAAAIIGVPAAPLLAAYRLAHHAGVPPMPKGPAMRHAHAVNFAYRAAFVVQAAKRLAQGGSLSTERQNLRLHLTASKARTGAAGQVDQAVALHGPLLGWRAMMDDHTTRGCAEADGGNFYVAHTPVIEGVPVLPGWLHGGRCRCVAVAPYPNGRLL